MAKETSSLLTDMADGLLPEVLASTERDPWVAESLPGASVAASDAEILLPAAERHPGSRPGGSPGRRSFDAQAAQKLADAYAARRDTAEGPELRAALIMELTPLVESVARKFTGCAEPVEDLVGEGFVGLIQAVDGYESGRGAKISTYATHRVAGQIKHYLRDRGKIIREPAWLQETTLRLTRAAEILQQELGRRPSPEEIAERVNLTEEAVQEIFMHRNTFQVLSITSGSGEKDDDEPFAIDTEKIRSQRYESLQLPLEDRIVLERLLGQLRDLERRAITAFFFNDLSQSDIARSLGISCNYAGYLLKNGLEKLRKWIHTEELRDAQLAASAGAGTASPVVDPDTEFYNGAYFRVRLIEEAARARRYSLPLALVLLRIEAPIQEEVAPSPSGPMAAGRRGRRAPRAAPCTDRDYRELAIAFRQCLRKADIPCRTAEHEFAVLLPNTGRSVEIVGRRLQRLAAQITGVPVQCGTAVWPEVGPDASALENAARCSLSLPPVKG
jgi:RNA polymerase sigma-B factor